MSFYLPSPYLPNIGSLNHAWHEECGIVIVGILYIYNLYLWRQQVICRGSVRVGAFASAGWTFIDACKRPAASDIFWPSKKKFTTFTLACQWDLSVTRREPETEEPEDAIYALDLDSDLKINSYQRCKHTVITPLTRNQQDIFCFVHFVCLRILDSR